MEDAKEQAKEQFARFRGSIQPRVDSMQTRIRQVPDKLQSMNIPEQLQWLPERIPRNFPRPGSPRGHARSLSNDSPPRPPASITPPSQLLRAPALTDPTFDTDLAALASKILYRSGQCPVSGGPLMVLCASAFPDANAIDYTVLLPYVLSNLPGDDELNGLVDDAYPGGYSVVFFAGGGDKKSEEGRPTWKWTLQAYTLVGVFREIARRLDEDNQRELADGSGQLGRAVRKKIQRLWVVHEKNWIRTILEIMAGVVSVKFKKKVVHLGTLSDLAIHVDITKLRIPPSVYVYDRKLEDQVVIPGFPPELVFGREPFRIAANPPRVGDNTPIPHVLVDTASYLRRSCLEVEGIFRVPASQSLLECARDCYDRKTSLHWEEWGPHTAAGLTKLYYRSLLRPMIPIDHYEQMESLVAIDPDPSRRPSEEEEREVRFEVVRALLTAEGAGLPEYSRILFLRHLLPLLSDVAAHQGMNKMNPSNLAVCVAGSLARSDDVAADARASAGIRKFVEIGIERIDELAPKLPLRRGPADAGHRRSQSSLSSFTSLDFERPTLHPIGRKKVPALTMPHWETPGSQGAIQRKPLPNYFGSEQDSPIQMGDSTSPLSFPSQEMPRHGVPQGLRPPPRRHSDNRASTYDGAPTSPHPVRSSSLTPVFPPAENTFPAPLQRQPIPSQQQPVKKPVPAVERRPVEKKPLPPIARPLPATAPSTMISLLRPTTSSSSTPPSLLTPGIFARPQLRRVSSVNFSPASEMETDQPRQAPALRRAKSQLIGKSAGVPVRELKMLWEEKVREEASETPNVGRRYSSVSIGR